MGASKEQASTSDTAEENLDAPLSTFEKWKQRGRAVLSTALLIIPATLLYFGLGKVDQFLKRQLAASSQASLGWNDIDVTPTAAWIIPDVATDRLKEAGLDWNKPVSLTDPTLIPRIGDAFRESPWVETVSVRIEERKVLVEVGYRRPILFVPWKKNERGEIRGVYVDATGTHLPPQEASEGYLRRSFSYVGQVVGFIPKHGEKFSDPRVAQAAGLAEMLRPHQEELNLARIVPLSGPGEEFQCSLVTYDGRQILWGEFNATQQGSLEARQKLVQLHEQLSRRAGSRPASVIDLRHLDRTTEARKEIAFGPIPNRT
ncbi:hypothetical protein Pan216_39900 [Planctomycetes bacterium Pan216]|uniref:Cell division protein FtsQ n=1 Tax=Kolteria novifilia TaxID=2527975 RepID=A0A518B810_9BACT|nr:hypothetical protein Pan216_39900 [Planctomycetes bacterium Pan216]